MADQRQDQAAAWPCEECGGETAHTLDCSRFTTEVVETVKDLVALGTAASDQAQAMTDRELGECLLGLNGKRWTTVEIHEAGRRLMSRG